MWFPEPTVVGYLVAISFLHVQNPEISMIAENINSPT
jgi:hypothetical protein